MIFSVFYVSWHVHRVFLLRLFTCLFLYIMPVVTRSQTKLRARFPSPLLVFYLLFIQQAQPLSLWMIARVQ